MDDEEKITVGNRGFKGIWIPKEVYLNEDLSWVEKILFTEIDSLNKGYGCNASNKYFGKFLGISEGRVANIISEHRKLGNILDISSDGRKRYISLSFDMTKTLNLSSRKREPEFTKTLSQVHENVNEIEENLEKEGSVKPQNEQIKTPNNSFNNTSIISLEEFKQKFGYKLVDLYKGEEQGMTTAYKHKSRVRPYSEEDVQIIYEKYIKINKKTKETKDSHKTEIVKTASKLLMDMNDISNLDGGNQGKYINSILEKITEDAEKRDGTKIETEDQKISALKYLLEMIKNKNQFHWKNMTGYAYLDKYFNKITREVL
jgi:hypothetical protein